MVYIKELLPYIVFVIKYVLSLESYKFEDIRHSTTYIDKTLLIKTFLNSKTPLVIATPSGFGKSSNLDMMRSFFSIDTNKTNIENLFKNTHIYMDELFMKNEFRKHVILYCSFKQAQPVVDYESMIAAFRSILHQTFAMYPYLPRSRKLTRFDKKKLTFYTGVKKHLKLERNQILIGLHFLSKVLRRHHGKEVILMIDDYDSIILDSLFSNELDYKTTLGFHNAILSAVIHNNKNTNKIILAGTSCTCIKPLTQLGNLQCISFLEDEKFVPFFGITEVELDGLLSKAVFKEMKHRKEEIREWYDGYASPDLKTHVYNTRSTLNCLSSGVFKSYWADTRTLKTMRFLLIEPLVQQLFDDSVNSKPIDIDYVNNISMKHMKGLKSFAVHEMWEEKFGDLFLYLLMEKGYFTFGQKWIKNSQDRTIITNVPNKDISTVFHRLNTTFYEEPEALLDRLRQVLKEVPITQKPETDDTLINRFS